MSAVLNRITTNYQLIGTKVPIHITQYSCVGNAQNLLYN